MISPRMSSLSKMPTLKTRGFHTPSSKTESIFATHPTSKIFKAPANAWDASSSIKNTEWDSKGRSKDGIMEDMGIKKASTRFPFHVKSFTWK